AGAWRTYTKADGLPSDDVNCLYEDRSGVMWIGTSAGLASIKSAHIGVPRTAPAALKEEVFGIAADKNGGLWVSTANHVLRLQREDLVNEVLESAPVREYSLADGLLGLGGVKRNPSVIAGPSGNVWFSLSRGLSVVDPGHTSDGLPPALAHIES